MLFSSVLLFGVGVGVAVCGTAAGLGEPQNVQPQVGPNIGNQGNVQQFYLHPRTSTQNLAKPRTEKPATQTQPPAQSSTEPSLGRKHHIVDLIDSDEEYDEFPLSSKKSRTHEKSQIDDKRRCMITYNLQEKTTDENHARMLKQEVNKLQDLVQVLRDQQYILNILNDVDSKNAKPIEHSLIKHLKQISDDDDKPENATVISRNRENPDDIAHLKQEVETLKEILNKTTVQPPGVDHKMKTPKIVDKLSKTEMPIEVSTKIPDEANRRDSGKHDEEISDVLEQLKQLKLIESKLAKFVAAKQKSNEEETVGAVPFLINRQNQKGHNLPNPAIQSRMNQNIPTSRSNQIVNQQKHPMRFTPKKPAIPPTNISKKHMRANTDANIDSLLEILAGNEKENDVDGDISDAKLNKLLQSLSKDNDSDSDSEGDLQTRLQDLEKLVNKKKTTKKESLEEQLKKLEKQIKASGLESRVLDEDEDEDDVRGELKKLKETVRKLSKKGKAESKSRGDGDGLELELKSLQKAIKGLQPKEDEEDEFDDAEGKNANLQVILNKLISQQGSGGHKKLTHAQLQLIKKKLIGMKGGANFGNDESEIYSFGDLVTYDGGNTFENYDGQGHQNHYGGYGHNPQAGKHYGPHSYPQLGGNPYSGASDYLNHNQYSSGSGYAAQVTSGYGNPSYGASATGYANGLGYGNGGTGVPGYGNTGYGGPSAVSPGYGNMGYGAVAPPLQGYGNGMGYGASTSGYNNAIGYSMGEGVATPGHGNALGYGGVNGYGNTGNNLGYGAVNGYGNTATNLGYGGFTGNGHAGNNLGYGAGTGYANNGNIPGSNLAYGSAIPAPSYINVHNAGGVPVHGLQSNAMPGSGYANNYPTSDAGPANGYGNAINDNYNTQGGNFAPAQHSAYGMAAVNQAVPNYPATNVNSYSTNHELPSNGGIIYPPNLAYGLDSSNNVAVVDPSQYQQAEPNTHPGYEQQNNFFPAPASYAAPGGQINQENYKEGAPANVKNPQQPYANPPQNTHDYPQSKVTDLKQQIYDLQNVISTFNKPEYLQNPEDKATVYKLDKQINDLKAIVTTLTQDNQYQVAPQTHAAPEYHQSNPQPLQNGNAYAPIPNPNTYSPAPSAQNPTYPANPTPSYPINQQDSVYPQSTPFQANPTQPPSPLYPPQQNPNTQYPQNQQNSKPQYNPAYPQMIPQAYPQTADPNQAHYQVAPPKDNKPEYPPKRSSHHHHRNRREICNCNEEPMKFIANPNFLKQGELIDQDTDKGFDSSKRREEETIKETHTITRRDLSGQDTSNTLHALTSLFGKVLLDPSDDRTARISSPPLLQSDIFNDVTRRIASIQNQLEYHPLPSLPLYDYNQYPPETTGMKLFKKEAKIDVFDKIFDKIIQKVIDKIGIAIPKLVELFFGGNDFKDYMSGYNNNNYNYNNEYSLENSFKGFGMSGFIPMIILKILSKIHFFVSYLQKYKFFKTFLIPALVLLLVSGSVIFLVWWLQPNEEYHKELGYSSGGGYGQNGYNSYNNLGGNYYKQAGGYRANNNFIPYPMFGNRMVNYNYNDKNRRFV